MKLKKFGIIVAVDDKNGIGKEGSIPWNEPDDLKFFKENTLGCNIIVGRITSLTLPRLEDRNVVIVSKDLLFIDALKEVNKNNNYTWIIGGEQLYNHVLDNYLYLVDKIVINRIKGDYNCDRFFKFNFDDHELSSSKIINERVKSYVYKIDVEHQEYRYLNAMGDILKNGFEKEDRTGVGTISLHGIQLRFDINKSVPFVTTKRLYIKGVREELLWFLNGDMNSKLLEEKGVNIWRGNSTREFLDNRGLHHYKEGELGPVYGHQWTKWGDDKINQVENVIKGLKNDPLSRRHIISAWNVSDLDKMALPPCHVLAQWICSKKNDKFYIDCVLTQRSGDMFLGIPFNIASYTMLTYMFCKETGYEPGELIINIGDAHIYKNHIEQVNKQLQRTPLPFCKMDYDLNVFDYISWPGIKAEMAV